MELTAPLLQKSMGCPMAVAEKWAQPLNTVAKAYGITSPERLAVWLAHLGHESGDLQRMVENLNYDAKGLARTWPNRYAVDPSAKVKAPNVLAVKLSRNPEGIANATYGGRFGNKNPGDGWKYKGRGPGQITFFDNYEALTKRLTVKLGTSPDFTLHPELLESAQWGAWAAGDYWDSRKLGPVADRGDFDATTQAWNGGQNGAPDRRARHKRALMILRAAGG